MKVTLVRIVAALIALTAATAQGSAKDLTMSDIAGTWCGNGAKGPLRYEISEAEFSGIDVKTGRLAFGGKPQFHFESNAVELGYGVIRDTFGHGPYPRQFIDHRFENFNRDRTAMTQTRMDGRRRILRLVRCK